MRTTLAPADRKFLWAAAGLFVLLVAGTFVAGPGQPADQTSVPSSYSPEPGGALAAYLLLQDLHYNVHRWQDPPAGLALYGSGTTLILASPTEAPTRSERQSLEAFVQRGGRILFCGGLAPSFFTQVHVRPQVVALPRQYPSLLPSSFSRGAAAAVLKPEALWYKVRPQDFALYGDSLGAVVVTWRIGAGDVVWWAGATPLTNAGVRQGSNLRLLLNAVGGASAIYWDEYFHGQRPSLWAYTARTPAVWALAQCGLLLLAVLLTFSRRSGPIAAAAAPSRLSPLEFVDTLGELYERAEAVPVAVGVVYRQLRTRLLRHLALSASTPDEELAQAAGQRLGWKTAEIGAALATASGAAQLRPQQALPLVQQLETYTAQLGVRRPRQEKED